MKIKLFLTLLLGSLVTIGIITKATAAMTSAGVNKIPYMPIGVTYSGLHASTNPDVISVNEDITSIANYQTPSGSKFSSIRTYYPQYCGNIGIMNQVKAKAPTLKVLLALYIFDNPQWTSGNYTTYVAPYLKNKNLTGVLVGNEDPGQLSTITTYINKIHADDPTTPVSSAQTTDFWLNDTRAAGLAKICDFIAVNIYPAWNWGNPDNNNQPKNASTGTSLTPQDGFNSFVNQYNQISNKYPDKQIFVTETGWPTTYGWVVNVPAQPKQYQIGIDNAQKYFTLVSNWSEENNVIVYYYSMFDCWYAVNTSSQFNMHFGLLDTNRKNKVPN